MTSRLTLPPGLSTAPLTFPEGKKSELAGIATLLILKGTLPIFVSVSVRSVSSPRNVIGKDKPAGDGCRVAPSPVPVSETAGVPGGVTVIVAARSPACVGLKVTLMVALAPDANVGEGVMVSVKSPGVMLTARVTCCAVF